MLEGNTFIQFSVQVIKLCVRLKMPVAVENACTRFLWWTSWMSALSKQHPPSARNFDFCSWKKPWRKRTKLWSRIKWSYKEGICDLTNKPHWVLKGVDSNGHCWSKVAEPYPKGMCTQATNEYRQIFEDQNICCWSNCGCRLKHR